MSPQAAREFSSWAGRVQKGLDELQSDGSIPKMPDWGEMMRLYDRLDAAILGAADEAERKGQAKCVAVIDFTDAEFRKFSTIGESMMSYIGILTTRGKVDGAPSAAVTEAITALYSILT